jgi:hypothetical protein
VGHIGEEFAFGAVGCLCPQHRLTRDKGGSFGLLFRLEEREAGVSVFDQASQPGTVAL